MNKYILIILTLLFINTSYFAIAQNNEQINNNKSDPNTPIFEIKNDLGQTIFAVYPGGVKIFVDDQLKAAGGGFTVGRLSTGKAAGGDILSVSPGNVNIYIDTASTLKAAGGGFTVGRLSTGKAAGGDIFTVRPNNVNVFIDDASGLKAAGGGFTVGRLSTGKKALGSTENFLTVTADSTRIFIDSNSTSGFAVGKIGYSSGAQNFMQLKTDNYFIGHWSGRSMTTGLYNSFLGYKAGAENTNGSQNVFFGYQSGMSNTSGSRNTFIGTNAGLNNISGVSNILIGNAAGLSGQYARYTVMIGDSAGAKNTFDYNIYIGNKAGINSVDGRRNLFIGYMAGKDNISGGYNTYLGAFSGMGNKGEQNAFVGYWAGGSNDVGNNNVFIGYRAGVSSTGNGNVFIGHQAGEYVSGSNKLYIETDISTNPLIYGEFDNENIVINGQNSYGNTFWVNGTASGLQPWGNTSDQRLKTDIKTIPNALNKVLSLRGVNFYWKDKKERGNKLQIGFIAQETENVLPEVVSKRDKYYTMQYAPITALLVEAVKEQQKQIETLKRENQALTQKLSKVDELKAELNSLKILVHQIAGTEKKETAE